MSDPLMSGIEEVLASTYRSVFSVIKDLRSVSSVKTGKNPPQAGRVSSTGVQLAFNLLSLCRSTVHCYGAILRTK